MSVTAIIAGRGALPAHLAARLSGEGAPFVLYELDGFAMENPDGWPVERFIIERLALLFDRLHAAGVTRVVFAGAVARPQIEPERIDPATAQLLPRLLPAFQQGDDALLRTVIALFEEEDFTVAGAADIAPDLLPAAGVLGAVQPSEANKADAARGFDILTALGPVDLGQGVVVAQGLCLAVETLPGTNAMLAFVGANSPGTGGVFCKAPKPGQDRRIDLPTLGPETVARAADAGLAGIAIEAGGVMILERAATISEAEARGLFLWAQG